MAMEESVKRRLRQEFAEAIKSGELDLSEIVENTGPRNADGTLKRSPRGVEGSPSASFVLR
jgi:hypothetical protein